jgi:hypothetical protein
LMYLTFVHDMVPQIMVNRPELCGIFQTIRICHMVITQKTVAVNE